jgi:hypothetical protein
MKAGTPYAAIGQMFDVSEFLGRVFGDDLDGLHPSERVYLGELVLVSLKAATGMAPMAEHLKRARVSEPEVRRVTPSESITSTRIEFANGREHQCDLRLAHGPSGWVIVDLIPTADTMGTEWAKARESGLTPIEFMEIFTGSMMDRREGVIDQRLAERRKEDADAARREVQAATEKALAEIRRAPKR